MSKILKVWKRVRESAENADGDASVYEIGDCDIIEQALKAFENVDKKINKLYDLIVVDKKMLTQEQQIEVFNRLKELLKEVLK